MRKRSHSTWTGSEAQSRTRVRSVSSNPFSASYTKPTTLKCAFHFCTSLAKPTDVFILGNHFHISCLFKKWKSEHSVHLKNILESTRNFEEFISLFNSYEHSYIWRINIYLDPMCQQFCGVINLYSFYQIKDPALLFLRSEIKKDIEQFGRKYFLTQQVNQNCPLYFCSGSESISISKNGKNFHISCLLTLWQKERASQLQALLNISRNIQHFLCLCESPEHKYYIWNINLYANRLCTEYYGVLNLQNNSIDMLKDSTLPLLRNKMKEKLTEMAHNWFSTHSEISMPNENPEALLFEGLGLRIEHKFLVDQATYEKAWRKLAILRHPDRASAENKAKATVEFQILSNANDTYKIQRGWISPT